MPRTSPCLSPIACLRLCVPCTSVQSSPIMTVTVHPPSWFGPRKRSNGVGLEQFHRPSITSEHTLSCWCLRRADVQNGRPVPQFIPFFSIYHGAASHEAHKFTSSCSSQPKGYNLGSRLGRSLVEAVKASMTCRCYSHDCCLLQGLDVCLR